MMPSLTLEKRIEHDPNSNHLAPACSAAMPRAGLAGTGGNAMASSHLCCIPSRCIVELIAAVNGAP
eukprot:6451034-Pyramimonas_sp.AAC.2